MSTFIFRTNFNNIELLSSRNIAKKFEKENNKLFDFSKRYGLKQTNLIEGTRTNPSTLVLTL